jgi:peptidoglycan/LPS O-acetylase OafA/YrhL
MYLSKNNYMVYLFHTRGFEYVARKLNITEANAGSGFIVVIGAYLVSLLLAFVANLCLKPIQSLLRKLLKINNNRQQ